MGLVHISRFVDRAILYELHTRFVRRAFSQELMIVPEPQRICRAYNNWQNRKDINYGDIPGSIICHV